MRWIALILLLGVLACDDNLPPAPTVQTGCVLDTQILEVGESHTVPNSCQTCSCTVDGLQCVIVNDCDITPPAPPPDPALACPLGRITGRACSPDGAGIPGAQITAATVDCTGNARVVEARADDAGHFLLSDLHPGSSTITITAGPFQSRHEVTVEADRTLPLDGMSDKTCLAADAARLAVVSGDYDAIEDILGRLGFEYDLYCGANGHTWPARQLLGDWDRLRQYDVVFINCGAHLDLRRNGAGEQMRNNLRRFVDEGGSVYASDLAAGLVDLIWTGAVRFESRRGSPNANDACCKCVDCPAECGFDDCPDCCGVPAVSCPETPALGRGQASTVQADITHPDLTAFLGDNRLEVAFDLGGWVQIAGSSVATNVLVRDGSRPLMVLFDVGEAGGRVAYTSFHNSAQASDAVSTILRALVFQL